MALPRSLINLLTLGPRTKRSVLRAIEAEYASSIPMALRSIPRKRTLYAALVPYFGEEHPITDKVAMGMTLWTMDMEHAKRLADQTNSPSERFQRSFDWADNFQRFPIEIKSTKLGKLLKKWYRYQSAAGSGQHIIDDIGQAISSACLKINTQRPKNDQLAPAFVVYTDCCSDDYSNYGLEECVTGKWRDFMENKFNTKIRDLTSRPQ